MEQLIILALVAILMALPACLIAYILLSFFPSSDYLMLALTSILSVVGVIIFLDYLQIKKQKGTNVTYEKVGTAGRILALIFTSLIGVYFVFKSNKVELYVDNQNDTMMNVSVNDTKLTLGAFENKKISVVKGKLTLKQGNTTKVLEPVEDSIGESINANRGNENFLIWNINGTGTYVKTEVQYGTNINFGLINKPVEVVPEYRVIKDELFKVKADFIFNIPKTIKTQNQYGFARETRMALYRLKDLVNEENSKGNYMEEQKPDYGLEDSVVVKSTKNKPAKK